MSFTAVVSGETAIAARAPVREAAERVLVRLWTAPGRLAPEDPALRPPAPRPGRPPCRPGRPGPGRAALDRAEEPVADARAAGPTEAAPPGRGARRPAGGNDRPGAGVYLQVTGNAARDVPGPGRHRRLGVLRPARALAAARAACPDGRPAVRPHLRKRRADPARLLDSARGG